jgi:RNA polymerase sigma factor (sigma-70 family)
MSVRAIELSDEALWSGLQNSEADAFTALIKRHSRFLLNYGRRFNSDEELVKDCLQDLFTDLWLHRNRLSNIVSVRTYLLVSLRRNIFRLNKRDLFKSISNIAAEDFPFMVTFSIQDQWIESEFEKQRIHQLNHIINSLPSRQKEILYLKFYQNLDHQEIAELMDMQYQSVSNLVQRALAQLRRSWKEEFSLSVFFCLIQ